MDKDSTLESLFFQKLDDLKKKGVLSEKYLLIALQFYLCFKAAMQEASRPIEGTISTFLLFLDLLERQHISPYSFETYHQKIRKPIDYYKFSLDFIRPLIDEKNSTLQGLDVLDKIESQLKNKENVIFLANHQTETDPQALAILLEPTHPFLAESMIYVAGERVITDPMAIPFSMGCDLLCVYSKRYIDHPPELKAEKQKHNKSTMRFMSLLLGEGGKAIYVAPSGGRDRKNAEGIVEVAPFDPKSVEMFYLMAKGAKTPTHFYPLTLSTYDLLPPPETIQKELGETRSAKYCPIHAVFSEELDMEALGSKQDKTQSREMRAHAIWSLVRDRFLSLTSRKHS